MLQRSLFQRLTPRRRRNGCFAASRPAAYVIDERAAPAAEGALVHVRAEGARGRQNARARSRIMMCAVVFVAVFAGLAGRLAFVSFGQPHAARAYAGGGGAPAPAMEIVDRNGALLATDLPMIALEVAGREVWDPRETAQKLAGVLPDLDADWLEGRLREGRYVEARAEVTPAEREAIFNLGLPGVRFDARSTRFYPQADLAAHLVGHGEPGKGGVMGLERLASLRRGPGPLVASVDLRIQQITEEELAATMERFGAKAAWGAVMDVASGEVIALASLPDFDPNKPGAAPADFRRNRAVYDRYELGSAFKALTAAAALDAGVAQEGSVYDARGVFRIADWTISDFRGENRELTLSEVVQHSSNIGMAQVAADLGTERQKAYLRKLGLFEALPVELRENRAPELPARWGPVETATIAYGHGISVTPLHLLAAFSAVVNGGVYRAPTFLASDEDRPGEAVFSPGASKVMRRILRRVVVDGSATYAEAAGYYPIGKTATADKPSASGGYRANARISSFVGAIPGYAPRYAFIVSFDEPQPLEETHGYATAGWNAAPAFAKIVERAAPLLGVAPVNEATALAAFVGADAWREARAATGVTGREEGLQ